MKLLIIDFNKTLYDPATDQLIAGSLEALAHYTKNNYTIVLLTTEKKNRAGQLGALGIFDLVKQVVFVKQKDSKTLQALLKKYAVEPADALVVGDDHLGELKAAQDLGIPAIAVGTGYCGQATANKMGIGFVKTIADLTGGYHEA